MFHVKHWTGAATERDRNPPEKTDYTELSVLTPKIHLGISQKPLLLPRHIQNTPGNVDTLA